MLQAGHTPLGLCSSTSCLLGSVEEELSVLPRHTKVIVTGNNRTKSVLVGLRGVVKKAVGLGGWHWLVLTNGVEVKLQRNALSVIEAPTGQEEDDESDTLLSSETSIDDFSRTNRPRVRLPKIQSAMPKLSVCTEPANLKASLEKRRGTSADLKINNRMRVDLSKLETAALRRYQRRFNLVEVGPNPSKEKLVDAVRRHFMSLQLDELQVIAEFVQAVKRLKT